jgi:hypothetical protein
MQAKLLEIDIKMLKLTKRNLPYVQIKQENIKNKTKKGHVSIYQPQT